MKNEQTINNGSENERRHENSSVSPPQFGVSGDDAALDHTPPCFERGDEHARMILMQKMK